MNLREFSDKLIRQKLTKSSKGGNPEVVEILDEFSTQCFSDDLNLWAIEPNRFSLDLPFINPDFLFVESAWNGNDGAWRYMVTSSEGPKEPLRKLVAKCHEIGIPAVFWNKEDPPHFDEFIRTAEIFDYVFTTDADMIPEYEKRTDAKRVELLRFAANMRLHTPERVDGYRDGDVCFAGQYFREKFPERRQQMEMLFPEAARHDFTIYSRVLGGEERYQFPDEYSKFIAGSLPYSEMVNEYKRHKLFLNVNSVPNSSTMCARRVYELSACKTVVLGVHTEAIRSVYDSTEVPLIRTREDARVMIDRIISDDDFRDSMAQRAWRKTLSRHTYENRVREILDVLGQQVLRKSVCIYVIIESSANDQYERLVHEVKSQKFALAEKVSVQLYSREKIDVDRLAEDELKEIYVAVVDQNFTYGKYFLNDLVLSARQSGSSIVAKAVSSLGTLQQETRIDTIPESGYLLSLANSQDAKLINDLRRVAVPPGRLEPHSVYVADNFGVSLLADRKSATRLNV